MRAAAGTRRLLLLASMAAIVWTGCGGSGSDVDPCEDFACGHLDSTCAVGSCDPDDGSCVATPRANGNACDDRDVCTDSSTCSDGVCVGDDPIDCSAVADDCNIATCDPRDGCIGAPVPNGTLCNDEAICDGEFVCRDGLCVGDFIAPVGDVCLDAISFPAVDGVTVAPGVIDGCNTNSASTSIFGQCGDEATGLGPEVVYRLDMEHIRQVTLETVTPLTGLPFDTVLHLRQSCSAQFDFACNDDIDTETIFSKIDTKLERGAYYIFVDATEENAAGEYELVANISAPNDCESAETILLPAPGRFTSVKGETFGATNAFDSTACDSDGPDHVYKIEVPVRSRIRFELFNHPSREASENRPGHLHIFGGPEPTCAARDSTVVACDVLGRRDNIRSQGLIEMEFEPGTYFAVVDVSTSSFVARYMLWVNLLPDLVLTDPQPTPLRGAPGDGTVFIDECPAGEVMVGVNATVSAIDRSIQRIQVVCGTVTVASVKTTYSYTTFVDPGTVMPERGTGGGEAAAIDCAEDEMVVGFSGRAGIASVNQLGMRCAGASIRWFPPDGLTIDFDAPDNRFPIGGTGGAAFPTTDCPDGDIAIGATIVAGEAIEGFALRCARANAE